MLIKTKSYMETFFVFILKLQNKRSLGKASWCVSKRRFNCIVWTLTGQCLVWNVGFGN